MINHQDYEKLIKKCNTCAYHYYTLDNPIISDQDYDTLYKQIKDYESENPLLINPNSPTQTIGSHILDQFEPFHHKIKLPSLSNAYNKEDIIAFTNRVYKNLELNPDTNQIEWSIEPKIDGLAVTIHYKNGTFTVAATRGNGSIGETITENIKTIQSLPHQLNKEIDIEVRGEVYIKKSNFEKLKDQFANPRNAAAGSIRQLDPAIAASRHLDIGIYHAISNESIDTHSKMMTLLEQLQFPVINAIKTTTDINELLNYAETLETNKDSFDYQIDGAVIKVNNYNYQDQLGSTNKAPRWAIAVKFAEEEVDTIIENIQFQIGRTGAITPVAQLAPVKLSGATITNATLHNMDEIKRLDIKVGDKVRIKRAGEVIPKIIKCTETYPHSKSIPIPTHCPCCNTQLIQEESEVALKCPNDECPDQVKTKISHYVSRNAMDIDGVGESIIDILLQEKLISNSSDLYNLKKEDLIKLERFAEKSTDNLLNAIQKSKEKPLENLIFALGIPFIGRVAATILAEKYGNLNDILNASIDELTNIDSIGEKIAKSISSTSSNSRFISNWESLKKAGINPTHTPASDGPLKGKSFLITGTLSQKRQDIESKIKSLGGNIANTVSKKLTYLIVGENPGSKLEKAEKLIEKKTPLLILNEEEFTELISNLISNF